MNQPRVTELTPLTGSGKWIRLHEAKYIDVHGKIRVWEVASRTTTPKSGVDAVAIGNILKSPSKPPSTILVLQFRPPVNAMTVEWPAGLIDANETAEQAALREFKEETGYVGKVINVGPIVAADPGMTSANMKLVMVEADLLDEMPEQKLEESEAIQRVIVPLNELKDRLDQYAEQGYVVAAKLWHWAAGVKFALESPELFKN